MKGEDNLRGLNTERFASRAGVCGYLNQGGTGGRDEAFEHREIYGPLKAEIKIRPFRDG